ncbi:hypothetical protein [Citrobacter amalonaticus]|uniref:hypothetical protein n=1 Tax=Citrobacter amalonaticus TaxID=35703 RepID=UPI0011AFC887|nr:hypothetical protein [Citrobacter amalonaticus]
MAQTGDLQFCEGRWCGLAAFTPLSAAQNAGFRAGKSRYDASFTRLRFFMIGGSNASCSAILSSSAGRNFCFYVNDFIFAIPVLNDCRVLALRFPPPWLFFGSWKPQS